ncbi:MAG: DUF6305 family protein [Eubacteriales bacterium]|nr:DUF6305 family protein [Eubacteriales bacterium]
MKKIYLLVCISLLLFCIASCGSKNETANMDSKIRNNSEQLLNISLQEPFAEKPVLLTSVGQSADVEMVKQLLTRANIEFTMNALATKDDIKDNKTLVLAIGGSSKGLGAAGIDANQEIDRINNLITSAKSAGLSIIALHIGGEARRGELSDKFIAPSFENADYAIVVSNGDKDGFMQQLARNKSMPLALVNGMTDVMEPLEKAFK